ncbi:ABC transporter permease [Sediminibacillus albus]|uniref:ABC-2 type transport system permease protein n=1 Tax=Sediminibacillus albus TaxID=407036 RepID=A0A1G8Y4Q4_9BACI|nr:ABC transporter permease [Sediminibacillus albus]SDJ97384.1 ABC-2 type transport system permease protein [Sediminibacillus albus]
MKAIVSTRMMHWRKQWKSLLCWLLLPTVSTLLFISIAEQWQEETKIPIGLVVEDHSDLAQQLTELISKNPLLTAKQMELSQALVQLEQHQLDSVFVIEDGYQENIKHDNRNRVVTAYASDMSFAYTPVKEAVASYVQEDASSSRAARVVEQLAADYGGDANWKWEEIVLTSKKIQEEESLLHTSFAFLNQAEQVEDDSISIWKVSGVWALFNLFTTFFLFDWLIKERRASIRKRLSLLRISFKSYLLQNAFLYLVLLAIFDVVGMGLLSFYFHQSIHLDQLLALLSFQVSISIAAFLFALLFRTTFFYYVSVIPITLLMAILGGAIVSVDTQTWPWIAHLSPLQPFLEGNVVHSWFIGSLIMITIWYLRKEKSHA